MRVVGLVCLLTFELFGSVSFAQGTFPSVKFVEGDSSYTPSGSYSSPASYSSPVFDASDVNGKVARFSEVYEGDWDAMCSYAQNNIRYLPHFGVIKGAAGALQGGRGTSFDQSQLLVQAYRLAGGEAKYVFGRVRIEGDLVQDLTGIDPNSTGAANFITDWFRSAGMPVSVLSVGANPSVEILHAWAQAKVQGVWQTCDPSLQALELRGGIDLAAASSFSSSSFMSTALSGASYGTDGDGVEWASSVNESGIQTALDNSAMQFASSIDAQFGESIPAIEDVIGGEIQVFQDGVRDQPGIVSVLQSTTWSGGIPLELKAKARIYGFADVDFTIYADEIANERLTLRWVSNDGYIAPYEDNGWDVPTNGFYELISGHRSLREIEEGSGDFQIARSSDVPADAPGNGMPFWGASYYEMSIDIDMPYPDPNFDRKNGAEIKKWVNPRGQNEIILAFGGISQKEKLEYTIPAGQDKYRHDIKNERSMCFETGQGAVSYNFTVPTTYNRAKQRWDTIPVEVSTGGNGSLYYQCVPWVNYEFWQHGWDQRFDILTDKDFVWRNWLAETSKLGDLLGRTTNSRLVEHYHVGLVTGSGGGNPPPAPYSLGDGELWIDADSVVGLSVNSQSNYSEQSIQGTYAAFLSTLEAGAIDETLLFDRVDWSDYGDNDEMDTFDDFQEGYGGAASFQTIAGVQGYGRLLKFTSSNFNASKLTDYPSQLVSKVQSYLATSSQTSILLPENHSVPAYFPVLKQPIYAASSSSGDNYFSFWQASMDDSNAMLRKGAGGTLTNIGGADYVRSRTEGGGLAFGASISDSGEWSYAPDADLVIGSDDFPYALSFQRSFSMNSFKTYPIKSGWSHNWEISAEYSSGYGQLTRPGNPRALGLSIAAIQAAIESYSSDLNPARLLVLSEIMSHWSDAAKENAVMIPGAGVFAKLPDGSFVPPPVAGNEAASLATSGNTLIYTSASKEVMTYQKLRPTDFCYPDDEANCYYSTDPQSPGYGLRAPDDIVRRYYATSWDFPFGVDINLTYSPATGVLTNVSNNLGRGFNFSYDANTACKYASADLECANHRRRYRYLQEVEDSSGRKIRFAPNGEEASGTSYAGCLHVFHSETGFSESSPHDQYCQPVKDPNTLTVDGYLGVPDFIVYRAGSDDPYLTVTFHDVYTGHDYSRIDSLIDAEGNTWNVQAGYGQKMIVAPSDDGGVSRQYYDQRGNLARAVSPTDWVSRAFFDARGRKIESQVAALSDDPRYYRYRTTTEYDAFSNVKKSFVHTVTPYETGTNAFKSWAEIYPNDPEYEPLEASFTYDVTGSDRIVSHVLTSKNPLGFVTTNTYKANTGQPNTVSGPSGEWVQYFYNSLGQVTDENTKLNASETSKTHYTYNADHYLDTVIAYYTGLNLTSSFDYDDVGNLESVTDPRGNTSSASYDLKRRMLSFAGPVGNQSVYEYDTIGRLRYLKQLRQAGGYDVTEIQYNDVDRPIKVIEPSGDFTTYSYNNANRLEETIDADGLKKKLIYYPGGQVEQIIKAEGTPLAQVEAKFWYDFDGEITRLRPARGNAANTDTYDTVYEKDPFGRTYKTIFADGSFEALSFNRDGTVANKALRLTAAEMSSGIQHYLDFTYDDSSRMTLQVERTVNGSTSKQNQKNYCYDLAGRVTRQFESAVTTITGDCDVFPVSSTYEDIVFDFDKLSRVESETANGRTVGYGYDASGNRTQIIWPDNVVAEYQYDAGSRLDKVFFAGLQLADYAYDIQSRLTGASLGNGTSLNLAYDADSLIDLLTHSVSSESGAAEALSWDYGYKPSGRLQSTELLDALHPEFVPDISRTIDYSATSLAGEAANALDQYEEIDDSYNGITSLDYDGRGNLITQGGRTYAYDFDNRLTGFTEGGSSVSYDYDVSGRRVGKIVDGLETRFLHAGDMEIAEYDDNGTLLRRYIPGGATDARVAWVEGSGTSLSAIQFYHADRLGNVAALTDSSGKVSARYAYDPFGSEVTGASTSGNPFRYTGRRFDPESGLYYYRARYYWKEGGRFLSTDPIGYNDQWNLYTYCGNDGLNCTDPSGMAPPDCASPSCVSAEQQRFQGQMETGILIDKGISEWWSANGGPVDHSWDIPIGMALELGQGCLDGGCGPAGPSVTSSARGAWGLADDASSVIKALFKTASRSLNVVQRTKNYIGGNIDNFMLANAKRFGTKLGKKIGQGRLPFASGKEGFADALSAIRRTLTNPSRISHPFKTSRGQMKVRDIYSEETGMTVRIRENGEFDTLIDEATKHVQ